MTIAALAKKFGLEVMRDGYDKIIRGARGYLYIDAGEVCAMWINAYARAIHLIGASGKRPKETPKTPKKPKETQ